MNRINILAFALLMFPAFAFGSRLHELVSANDVEAVRAYLESTPKASFLEINKRDRYNEVPLEIAARLKNDKMQALLIEFGAGFPQVEAGSPCKKSNARQSAVIPRSRSNTPTMLEKVRSIPPIAPIFAALGSQGILCVPVQASEANDDEEQKGEDLEDAFFKFDE